MALSPIINHTESEEKKKKDENNLNFVRDQANILQMRMNGVLPSKF